MESNLFILVDPDTQSIRASVRTAGAYGAQIVNISDSAGAIIDSFGSVALTVLVSGQTTVAVAGTEVALTTTAAVDDVAIAAPTSNAGNIFVGPTGVDSTTGYILEPGMAIVYTIDDPATVYVDAATSGDKVSWSTLA